MTDSWFDMQSTVPYIISETGQNSHLQEEVEMATTLLLALSRQGYGKPDSIVKANYPFMVFESEEEAIVFDLLGLSMTEMNWLLPKDLSEALDGLENAKASDEILNLLNKGKEVMDQEAKYSSTIIEGMVEQENLRTFIVDFSCVAESKDHPTQDIFKPLLTKSRFTSLRKNIKAVYKGIENNILSAEQSHDRIESIMQGVKKAQDKKLSAFKKACDKRLATYQKEKEKTLKDVEKKLLKDSKTIDDEFKESIKNKTDIIEIVKENITSLGEKLKAGADGEAKKELKERKKTLERLNKEVRAIEDEHGRRLSLIVSEADSEKQRCDDTYTTRFNEETVQIDELLGTHEKTLREFEELMTKVSDTATKMRSDAEALSKALDIKYAKGKEVNIPFYVFRYGEEYWFNPPVKFSEGKGIGKTLKLMLTSSLGNKVGQFVSPQTNVFDDLLEKAINSLNDETELSDQYIKALPTSNILESRESLDKMMIGLYKVMDWDWISEKDYIDVQRFLLEKLDYLNGGNVFAPREEVTEIPDDLPEMTEAPVIE